MSEESRIETMLRNILGETEELPVPVSRIEKMLANMCGGAYEIDPPVSRIEHYLKRILENGSGGGGGNKNPTAEDNDVIFIDYDGTIRYSYTAEEFLALTEMPANPEHDGLVAEGWNWTLAGAKSYVQRYGAQIIGQTYATESGATEIYVDIPDTGRAIVCNIKLSGAASIDWGDGSTPTELTGSNNAAVSGSHEYATGGKHVIKITVTGTATIYGSGYQSLLISSVANRADNGYIALIKEVHIGPDVILDTAAFGTCAAMKAAIIPKSVTNLGSSAFSYVSSLAAIVFSQTMSTISGSRISGESIIYTSYPEGVTYSSTNNTDVSDVNGKLCLPLTTNGAVMKSNASMKLITIPEGVTELGSNFATNCYQMETLDLPSTMTKLNSYAFRHAYSMRQVRVRATTPPTLGSYVFDNALPGYCKIIVPAESVEAYKAATNWSRYASQIIGE